MSDSMKHIDVITLALSRIGEMSDSDGMDELGQLLFTVFEELSCLEAQMDEQQRRIRQLEQLEEIIRDVCETYEHAAVIDVRLINVKFRPDTPEFALLQEICSKNQLTQKD